MPIFSLIMYNNSCSKTSGSLWQYYRNKPALNDADVQVKVLRLNLKKK